MLFSIVVGIGMVLEPPHQEIGLTYCYGVEGTLCALYLQSFLAFKTISSAALQLWLMQEWYFFSLSQRQSVAFCYYL